MAITLSHQSALDAMRITRANGSNPNQMDTIPLRKPSAWVGNRLSARNFDPAVWRWQQPSYNRPLHILVPTRDSRTRSAGILAHTAWRDMPAGSILWLDEHASMVCPELLFLQMASVLSLPMLVMLGHELCGHFSRCAHEPLTGDIVDGIPAATSVGSLAEYLATFKGTGGLLQARKALNYVCDHALSAPEATLSTIYALPVEEDGYGLGAVTLNDHVQVNDEGFWERPKSRYPDLTLGIAPVGVNYDGSMHFDVSRLMRAAEAFARADIDTQDEARKELKERLLESRSKVIDDNMRNRQLAAQGKIIFSATKEDLVDGSHLDALTRQLLHCAHNTFGIDIDRYEQTLDDTSRTRDRWELLDSLLPHGYSKESSYGLM